MSRARRQRQVVPGFVLTANEPFTSRLPNLDESGLGVLGSMSAELRTDEDEDGLAIWPHSPPIGLAA